LDHGGSLIKKAPPRREVVDLNAAILEVIALSNALKDGVVYYLCKPVEDRSLRAALRSGELPEENS